jgi:sugar O-acyltransferase (sialic acid O-acetyltransferase NeuD family)
MHQAKLQCKDLQATSHEQPLATRERMKRFAIFGASGCGRGVMPIARQQLQQTETESWELVFVDDNPPAPKLNGHRVLHYEEWLSEPASSHRISLAISNGTIREKLDARCAADGVIFFDVQAANVIVMDDVLIGPGAVLSPFVTLTSNIRIGRHFHANLYSYVEHDCAIGDFVTFAPDVHCNGNVVVEDHAYIGAGATLRQGKPGAPLVIGRGAVVGMGAVVTRNVAPGCTVVGNPARVME